MGGDGGVGAMVDRSIIIEIVENENWKEARRYLRELKEDLREGFRRLNECLTCPPNSLFCSEVARLVESYQRALLATLMLKCLLNEALRVVEDGKLREELNETMEVVDDLVSFLNRKHDLVNQLVEKCKPLWGGNS
jgi:predicted house-cleaning noncanonical NTP pyrophosphatase (MazG superfamily)